MDDDFYVVGSKSKQGAQDYVTYLDRATHNGGHVGETRKERRNQSTNNTGSTATASYTGPFTIEVVYKEVEDKDTNTGDVTIIGKDTGKDVPTSSVQSASKTWDDVQEVRVYDSSVPLSEYCGRVYYGNHTQLVHNYVSTDTDLVKIRAAQHSFYMAVYYNAVLETVELVPMLTDVNIGFTASFVDSACCYFIGSIWLIESDKQSYLHIEQTYQGERIEFKTGPRFVVANHTPPFIVCATYFANYPLGTGSKFGDPCYQTVYSGVVDKSLEDIWSAKSKIWLTKQDGKVVTFFSYGEQMPPNMVKYSEITPSSLGSSVKPPHIVHYDDGEKSNNAAAVSCAFEYTTSMYNMFDKTTPIVFQKPLRAAYSCGVSLNPSSHYYTINAASYAVAFPQKVYWVIDSKIIDVYFVARHFVRTYGSVKKRLSMDEYDSLNKQIINAQNSIGVYTNQITELNNKLTEQAKLLSKTLSTITNSNKQFAVQIDAYINRYLTSIDSVYATYAKRIQELNIELDKVKASIENTKKKLNALPQTEAYATKRKQLEDELERLYTQQTNIESDISVLTETLKSTREEATAGMRKDIDNMKDAHTESIKPLTEQAGKEKEAIGSIEKQIANTVSMRNEAIVKLQQLNYSLYGADSLTDAFVDTYIIDATGHCTVVPNNNDKNNGDSNKPSDAYLPAVLKQTPTSMDIVVGHLYVTPDSFTYTDYHAHEKHNFRITPYCSTRSLQDI